MALYLVVHHGQDRDDWGNHWLDDDRLHSITTTTEIGRLCSSAKNTGERVFIHRCGWGSIEPTICCSVLVSRAVNIGSGDLVEFTEPVVLDRRPPVQPGRGQNFYEADPV
jgi:hypothetical protein